MQRAIIYSGPLIHSITPSEIQSLPRALVAVSAQGLIEWIVHDAEPANLQELVAEKGWDIHDPSLDLIVAKDGEWIMPGFVDTHTVCLSLVCLGASN
jgi:guanine deaminase